MATVAERRMSAPKSKQAEAAESNTKNGIYEREFKRRDATRDGGDIPLRGLKPTATVMRSLRDQDSRTAANRRRQVSGVAKGAVMRTCLRQSGARILSQRGNSLRFFDLGMARASPGVLAANTKSFKKRISC